MIGDIIILHKRIKGHDDMSAVPEIWCVTFIFHFGLFFSPFYTPNDPKNQN